MAKKCKVGYTCGISCISRKKRCWSNLDDKGNKLVETFTQYLQRVQEPGEVADQPQPKPPKDQKQPKAPEGFSNWLMSEWFDIEDAEEGGDLKDTLPQMTDEQKSKIEESKEEAKDFIDQTSPKGWLMLEWLDDGGKEWFSSEGAGLTEEERRKIIEQNIKDLEELGY